jgi:hypothetical protein
VRLRIRCAPLYELCFCHVRRRLDELTEPREQVLDSSKKRQERER